MFLSSGGHFGLWEGGSDKQYVKFTLYNLSSMILKGSKVVESLQQRKHAERVEITLGARELSPEKIFEVTPLSKSENAPL